MSRERFDLDPDEAHVRALVRRSDGPVLVRPFRHERARSSALPMVAAAAAVLVLGVIVGTSLGARRQEVASPPVATGGLPAPSATGTPAPTATPEPTPTSGAGGPVSAGAVPEVGTLYLIGSDDLLYRYDGATGRLVVVAGRVTFVRETRDGVVTIGRDGAAEVLRWDGTTSRTACGAGEVLDISRSGACVYREADDTVTVSLPGRTDRISLSADRRVTDASWDDAGRRLAILGALPGTAEEERAHNGLWLYDESGAARLLYEPSAPEAFVTGPRWSPDGRWIAVFEAQIVSNSIARDGTKLLVIDVGTGVATDLGTAFGHDWTSWSPASELTFIRGAGRETWRDKRLVIRAGDGTEREVALPDASYVQLAPAWSAAGDLAFVVGPSGTDIPPYMDGQGVGDRRGFVLRADGSTRELRCPNAPLEGIRPSADGRSFLILCRTPGTASYPLSVWFTDETSSTPVPLVHGLGEPYGGTAAGGFGYYGKHPHLRTITAWSLAAR